MGLTTQKESGFTLIEVMMVVMILGIVSAIAVPNFLRYQAKARQAEARQNLGGIFVAEIAYFGELSRYGTFNQIGFSVAGASNRYTYRSGIGGDNIQSSIPPGVGVVAEGTCGGVIPASQNTSPMGFTATASANLDQDAYIDHWFVNDVKIGLTPGSPGACDDVAF